MTVEGDFYHLDGGMLAMDLGGHDAGVDYDVLNVLGKVELQGDLSVSLVNGGGGLLSPELGDTFDILMATSGVTGQFAHVLLPDLTGDLAWQVDYLSNEVQLAVYSAADFNRDRVVDAADYTLLARFVRAGGRRTAGRRGRKRNRRRGRLYDLEKPFRRGLACRLGCRIRRE